MNDLVFRATDPAQYDKLGNRWIEECAQDKPWKAFFKTILSAELGDLNDYSVLDIGCGTGWLSEFVFSQGAESYLGVEPSKLSYEKARVLHPKANFINAPLEDFSTSQAYDLITCIMSTEHIKDLEAAFSKFCHWLRPNGRLAIIAADLISFTTPRYDYQLLVDWLSDKEAIVFTARPNGVDTVDIVRDESIFLKFANQNNLFGRVSNLTSSNQTTGLIDGYNFHQKIPHHQFLIFTKADKV